MKTKVCKMLARAEKTAAYVFDKKNGLIFLTYLSHKSFYTQCINP